MILFTDDSKSAAFWFAAEEYVMRILRPEEPALMLWSTDDTVMVGANQVIEKECDLAYMESTGVEVVRRPSGGGAIFTDRGTLQVSVILPYEGVVDSKAVQKEWLARPIIDALESCGVSASFEGRNDIKIDGDKVSGMAQHIQGGYICSHCSLLYRTDLKKLASCLSADESKFSTKAVASARLPVANISEHIPDEDFPKFFTALSDKYSREGELESRGFARDEHAEINSIVWEKFLNPEWLFGREPAFTFTNEKRFPGGTIEVFLDVKGGVIRDAKLSGDFLSLQPVSELEAGLVGAKHRADALSEILDAIDVRSYLGSLDTPELLEVLL